MSTSATRRSARALAAVAAVAVVPATVVALTGSALAAGSYGPSPKCSSATGSHTPGSTVTLSGVGFAPGATVDVGGTGGAEVITKTTKADSNGAVSVKERLGNGSAQFTLSGTRLSATCGLISVLGTTASTSAAPSRAVPTSVVPSVAATIATRPGTTTTNVNSLPFTGASHVGDAALLGAGLLLIGGGMIAFTRRPAGAHH